jgi:hypothetical protein
VAAAPGWESFAQMVGGASGALTGLLFVAVSLNRDQIAHNRELRASAAQTLVLLILPLAVCMLLLTPGQAAWALGSEIIALSLVTAVVLEAIARGKHAANSAQRSRLARLADRRSTNMTVTILMFAGGVSYLAGYGGGLYWLVPTALFALLGGVFNAWLFLIEEAG